MNDQYDNPDMAERTYKDINNPEVNPDPYADKAPVVADLIHEPPTEETAIHDIHTEEIAIHEAPTEEAAIHETITHETPHSKNAGVLASVLNHEASEQFRTRWNEIQVKFVDEPRTAVDQADKLVTDVIEQITQRFASEHSLLEGEWKQGKDVSTEDLRIALQRYRSFFNSLVV